MKTRSLPIPAAAAVALLTSTLGATASPGQSLSAHAHRIVEIADDLAHEFRLRYRHTRGYRHLVPDISEIQDRAHHIDRLSHDCRASLHHIQVDLRELDNLTHHLHEVVEELEHHARHHPGHSHIHGPTCHVHRSLDALKDSIHAMELLVEDLRASHHHRQDHHHRPVASDPIRIVATLLWALAD